MPPLGAKERAKLPDSAFAYIDSHGKRRLPIHDAAHVRNALARFSQVAFEDEGARDKARTRLLRAAKKHDIVPIGFVSAQLLPQRKLPKGQVTFLLTDIEGSTELLGHLDDRYAPLLADVRRLMRAAVRMPVVARWTRARMNSSPSSNKPRRRSRPLWRSSGRCKGVPGPTGSTSGCGSVFTAGVRPSPTPATSASRCMPPPASASRHMAVRSSCLP